MSDEFDWLCDAQDENDLLRGLLTQADEVLVFQPKLKERIQVALSGRRPKPLWALGAKAAIRQLKRAEQAEMEAHHEYTNKEYMAEAKIAYERSRAFGLAVEELQIWLGEQRCQK